MSNSFSRAKLICTFYESHLSQKHHQFALREDMFLAALHMERRRAERSGAFLLLASVRLSDPYRKEDNAILTSVAQTLISRVRETDVVGWSEADSVIGILFTEVRSPITDACCTLLEDRMKLVILKQLGTNVAERVRISFSQVPEIEPNSTYAGSETYPFRRGGTATVARSIKRMLDIVVSLAVLIVCSPALLLIVLCIKLTSHGPVIYKQARVGKHGRTFMFLKFRSMFHNSDSSLHEEFVSRYIENTHKNHHGQASVCVYKMVDDPRITPLGRFLRRTSLDEFPQLINVLRGEMSLVGPRPPLPYEFERYKPWHRRRVLESIPGITGLWQIQGRSRLSFDDAVRLDLDYIKNWSLWLDLQILLKTPAAVLSGNGAY